MAIIKTGDVLPIVSVYDDDGEENKCQQCGDKLVIIAMTGDDNKLICEHCEELDK